MEVGHKMIDCLEFIARIDENIRPAGLCAHGTVVSRDGLQRAAGCCADRPDLAACGTRIVDDPRGLFVHDIILGVHDVVGDLILLDRAERTQTDMQRHERQFYSLGFQRVKQLGREVQAGGRCSCRARCFGVNRLVAFGIIQLFLDIRRQRHGAELVEDFQENALIVETDQAVAVRLNSLDGCGQQAVTEGQLYAGAGLFARTRQALPQTVALVGQQQHLDRRNMADSVAHQTRRNDARIVEYHAVARLNILQQIAEMTVRHRAVSAVEHHQTGRVTLLQRMLGNQAFG